MGSTLSYFYNTEKKLCNEIITDEQIFLIKVLIRTSDLIENNINDALILDLLQKTNPYISYMHNRLIYLLYDGSKKEWDFKSNISGDIISFITAEITKCCIKNNICDPNIIEIQIIMQPYQVSLNEILKAIKYNNYTGNLAGPGSSLYDTQITKI
jgi:hypothetical protein